VIHDFGELTTELGKHDQQIRNFVSSSDKALGNFANQQEAVQEAFEEFPATLRAAKEGLSSSNEFSKVALPTLTKLIPQAQASTPAFKATEKLFSQTAEPIRKGIRPFTREIRPVLSRANEGATPLEKTVRSFGNSVGGLNSFFNELAYKPKGSKQSYLFYLPWLNHDFNSAFSLEDGGGAVLRSSVLLSCTGSSIGYGTVEIDKFENLQTLLELIGAPRAPELPNPYGEPGHCTTFKGTSK
jgi:phospholipid/cholesterol/gamma-HCH transport system substrate-binding protein